MDLGKKMMEKMGWKNGQGLGKDSNGMTSCLTFTKNNGSSAQGRIQKSTPIQFAGKEENDKMDREKLLENQMASLSEDLAIAVPGTDPAEAAKRRKIETSLPSTALIATASGLYDIDPRDCMNGNVPPGMAEAAAAAAAALQSQVSQMQVDPAAAAAKMEAALRQQQQQLAKVAAPVPEPEQKPNTDRLHREKVEPTRGYRKVTPKQRQWVNDDWRWSKGYESLRYFEELQLASTLQELSKKVLGEGSRYPARIADETDCVVEVTAWGSLLVRPRGTGANVELAKRMLYEILHPMKDDLREDVLFTPDEMVEAALRDQTTISSGTNDKKLVEGVQRSNHGLLRRVGIGAEDEAKAENEDESKVAKSDSKEITLATAEDAALMRLHLEDLRIATGATPILIGMTLKLAGKAKQVRKAQHLVTTLIETGEWVALTEGFAMSEETKEKRRQAEGPSEQILIKIPEGTATQCIEKHLTAMERASLADKLKLTSKAVNGKRTLMVEGTRAAHERVKLMVKELSEKGESVMLNKALGVARAGRKASSTESTAAPALLRSVTAGGVITAGPVLVKNEDVKIENVKMEDVKLENVKLEEDSEVTIKIEGGADVVKVEDEDIAVKLEETEAEEAQLRAGLGAAKRKLPTLGAFAGLAPPVRKAASGAAPLPVGPVSDLFAGLPAPEVIPVAPGGVHTSASSAAPAAFPPVPPGAVDVEGITE